MPLIFDKSAPSGFLIDADTRRFVQVSPEQFQSAQSGASITPTPAPTQQFTQNTIAPGLPGGPDPAMVGSQIMQQQRAGSFVPPPAPTAPAAPPPPQQPLLTLGRSDRATFRGNPGETFRDVNSGKLYFINNNGTISEAEQSMIAAGGVNAGRSFASFANAKPVDFNFSTDNPGGASQSLGRKLGPTEFEALRRLNNVAEHNFDEFFNRDAQGNIYLKPTAPGPAAQSKSIGLPSGSISVDPVTGAVQPGEATLESLSSELPGVTDFSDLSAVQGTNTTSNSLTEFIQQMQAERQKFQDQILLGLQPTERELELQKQVDDLISSAQKGITDQEGRTVPLAAIRGEQALIEKRAQDLLLPLQQELERAQTGREGTLKSLTTAFGFQQNDQELQAQIIQEMRKPALDAQKAVQDYIIGLATEYPDAGISFSDTAEQAAAKVSNSAIYQNGLLGSSGAGEFDKLLTPNEASALGLPYGTTRGEAAQLGILPKSAGEFDSPAQQAVFNSIVDKYGKNSIINSAEKMSVTEILADQIMANPESATNQLASLYSLVKVLDPDSAVREGELALSNQTQSYFQRFSTSLARLEKGQVLNPDAAYELASATKSIAQNWKAAAARQESKYRSQATVNGVGSQWDSYVSGFAGLGSGGSTSNQATSSLPDDIKWMRDQGYSDKEIFDALVQEGDISPPKNQSVEPGAYLNELLKKANSSAAAASTTSKLSYLGPITGYGSKYWAHGLDIDLKVGDPVRSPVSGKVVFSGQNGGFGNQVKVLLSNGEEVWFSHLDSTKVKVGDMVTEGNLLGIGGKTGKVIPVGGGDGSHLDLTVKKKDGSYLPPEEVARRYYG